MKHFFNRANGMSKHAISTAAIIDSDGNLAGKIVIRFTDSQVGWNHEAGVLFYPADIDFSDSRKGSTYSQPDTLYYVFREAGIKCFDWQGRRFGDYSDRHDVMIDSQSRFNDIATIKHGRKKYRLLWII